MSNTLIEMQARHQIHERLARRPPRGCRLRPAATGVAERLRKVADRVDN